MVTGMSYQWDTPWQDPNPDPINGARDSPWMWVRIYNSFTNKTEYYPWRFFKPAYESLYHNIMRVDARPRSYTDVLLQHISGCNFPEYVRRRLK
jgi:hypothetical protein